MPEDEREAFKERLASLRDAAPLAALAQPIQVTGAGASFPNPIYQRWGEGAKAAGIELNYQSVGSGAGASRTSKSSGVGSPCGRRRSRICRLVSAMAALPFLAGRSMARARTGCDSPWAR